MLCVKCGAALVENAAFCHSCGCPVTDAPYPDYEVLASQVVSLLKKAFNAQQISSYVGDLGGELCVISGLRERNTHVARALDVMTGATRAGSDEERILAADRLLENAEAAASTTLDRASIRAFRASLNLLAGDLAQAREHGLRALRLAGPAELDTWWPIHAAMLGMCYVAAWTPPATYRPFTATHDGRPADSLLTFLGANAAFLIRAAGDNQPEITSKREIYEAVAVAASAIHDSVAPGMYRAAAPRLGSRLGSVPELGRGGPERQADFVDRCTDGEWQFKSAIERLHGRWTDLADALSR